MKTEKAYCPASITLLFNIHLDSNPVKMGSTGIGFTINKGVTAAVRKAKKNAIYFNNKKIIFPTVLTALNALTSQTIEVRLTSSLPLGYGFGLSSSSSLSTCFAVNALLGLNMNKKNLIEIAHVAEVVNKTGLGSVATQTIGGFLQKKTPGPLPIYSRLPFEGQKIYAIVLSKIVTSTVLSNPSKISGINNAYKYFEQSIFTKKNNLAFLFDQSYQFAKKANLLREKKLDHILNGLIKKGFHATVTMLGEVILTTQPVKDRKSIPLIIQNKTVKLI